MNCKRFSTPIRCVKFSLFSYFKAKFNKYEYLKSPVVLLVKLLNPSFLSAFQCQQNKTDNHSFSQGIKWLCWHWSLKKSTWAHTTQACTQYYTSASTNTPLHTCCIHTRTCTHTHRDHKNSEEKSKERYVGERCILHTWINNPLFMCTTGSVHQHKHSSNPILLHYSLGCITDT